MRNLLLTYCRVVLVCGTIRLWKRLSDIGITGLATVMFLARRPSRCETIPLIKTSALKLSVGRTLSVFWRFGTLRLAEWVFSDASSNDIVCRPFCGFRLFLRVCRSNAHRLLYLQGERYVEERDLLAQLLEPGMRVVDVGANIGYYLLMFERAIGAAGSVICFEPEPANLDELRRNVSGNSFENVTVLPQALSSSRGRTRFAKGINGGILPPEVPDAPDAIEVELTTLDDALNGPIDLLKIDVEGYEGHVLEGGAQVIDRYRPTLFLELHPDQLAPPYTLATIDELLRKVYPDVIYYSRSRSNPVGKILERYFGCSRLVREQTLSALSNRIRRGECRAPFWAICRSKGH